MEKEEPEEFFYRINLTLPIEPQIKAIKKHATVNKESRIKNNSSGYVKQKRLHVNKLPLYLRVYDAVQAGEKERAIADFLSYEDNVLSEKDVNNAYEAADKFVQGEYIFIPLPK